MAPYVDGVDLANIPIKDRERLNPKIFALTGKMRQVKSRVGLLDLGPEIVALTGTISEVAGGYGYEGAFAGELNYSLHMILFDLIPDTRYWVAADITGSLELLLHLFKTTPLHGVQTKYLSEIDGEEIPFGKKEAFIDIVEWAFLYVAVGAAPDNSRRSRRFIAGVLRHIDTELYRRLWTLYEELQIERNGDVPGYVKWRQVLFGKLEQLRQERKQARA